MFKQAIGQRGPQIQDELIAAMKATGTGVSDAQKEEDVPLQARLLPGLRGTPEMKALIEQNLAERVRQENIAKAQAIMGATQTGKTRQDAPGSPGHDEALLPKQFGDLTEEDQKAQGEASDAAQEQFEEGNNAWKKLKHANAIKRKEAAQRGERSSDGRARETTGRAASETARARSERAHQALEGRSEARTHGKRGSSTCRLQRAAGITA